MVLVGFSHVFRAPSLVREHQGIGLRVGLQLLAAGGVAVPGLCEIEGFFHGFPGFA